jgi:hypothetical protein
MRTDYARRRRLRPSADTRDPRNLLLAKEYRAGGTRGRLVLEF